MFCFAAWPCAVSGLPSCFSDVTSVFVALSNCCPACLIDDSDGWAATSVLMLSRDFFHVVIDVQTPLAHWSGGVPVAVLVVVLLPPPPQAATESTSATIATPQSRKDPRFVATRIRAIGSLASDGSQEARTSPGGRRASLLGQCSPLSPSRSRSRSHRSRTSSGSRSRTARR